MFRYYHFSIACFFVGLLAAGQVSPDCSSAIPICYNTPINGGTSGFANDDFNGALTTGCLEQTTSGAIESNSAWYRFRTNASGQLGFNIMHDPAEDWDFALYQATDCSNLGEPIRCNFFDNSDGNASIGVGEDPTGDQDSVQYEDWLHVEPGQDFFLLINNFSDANSGFSIQFSGTILEANPNSTLDCTIINNLLGSPIVACEPDIVTLDATTMDAFNYVWYSDVGNGFEEILGENNPTLQVSISALYRVSVMTPTENIISDVQVSFSVVPTIAVVENETYCLSGAGYDLSRKDEEALGSQSADDFFVSYYLSQQDAELGINELPSPYIPDLGTTTVFVRMSSRQNPDCYDASQNFDLFTIAPPVLGEDEEVFLCENVSTINIGEETSDPNYAYSWDTGENSSSISVSEPGTYILTATVSDGNVFCVRTRTFTVIPSAMPVISDVLVDDFSYRNTIQVVTELEGDFEYRLDDGEFQDSSIFENLLPGNYRVYMRDLNGCGVTCAPIAVVGYNSFFSPNGDDRNDEWHLLGMEYLDDPKVTIYDRYGRMIIELTANGPGWDGTFNGTALPGTDYWFKLSYKDDTGSRLEPKFFQNHFSLRR